MKLTFAVIAASLVIRFTTPGAGAFWLISTSDGYWWDVEMCAPVDIKTHVAFTVPPTEACRWFAVLWEEE